jgi:hypothetical protein
MVKVIDAYDSINAASIYGRATKAVCDMDVVGTTVECSNFRRSKLRNVLGENTFDLASLCMSNKVNPWSYFSNKTLGRDGGGNATISTKTPYRVSDFAGYNHNAMPPGYYNSYLSSWAATKNSSFAFSTGFQIRAGERYPDDNIARRDYLRVKVVIDDTLNSRTLTAYSGIFSISEGSYTSVPVTYTDDRRGAVTGTATIECQYVNSNGSVIYGLMEDSHPGVAVNIGGYYTPLYDHDFTVAGPSDAVRFYYVMSDTPPYNALTYVTYGSNPVFHVDHCSWNTATDLILINGSSGSIIPDPHVSYPANNWPRVCAVIYNSGAGTYRKYLITGAAGDAVLLDTYRVDSTLGYAYYLDYEKALTGWPTTTADL